MGKLMLR